MNFNFLRSVPVNLLRYLPKELARDEVFKNTLDVCSGQHEKMRLKLMDIARQFFVSAATWGLDDWERVLAIPTVRSEVYEVRRNRILLKLQGCQTSSLPFMNALLNRYVMNSAGRVLEHNETYTFEIIVDVDKVHDWKAMIGAIEVYKPAHLAMYLVMTIFHKWEIHHYAECQQLVDARHKVWNFGHVRTIRFDSEFDFDRAIRWDAIYGDYRERQQHRVEIWCTVEAWQRNLVPVNVLDGDFEFLGNHTWSGMAMIRVPKHKSTSCGIVEVQQKSIEVRNSVAVMNSPEVYLENPISYTSANLQFSDSHQEIKSRQISETIESVVTSHEQKSSHVAAVKQTPVSSQKINIKNRVVSTNKVVATQNTDYRTASLADGSFCMDGTHVFEGAVQQNYAKAAHCCSIARITKNGIGRIERT